MVIVAVAAAAALFPLSDSVVLTPPPGNVAQLIEVRGEFWVRTHDPLQPAKASSASEILVYSPAGELLRRRATASLGVTKPSALAAWREGALLADYGTGQVVELTGALEKRSAHLLRGNHPYPYYPRWLAVDGGAGVLFVTGCYPLQGYLDLGCLQVHEFSGPSLAWQASGLETPPLPPLPARPVSWKYLVGASPHGSVWVVAEGSPLAFNRARAAKEWKKVDLPKAGIPWVKYPADQADRLEAALHSAPLATGVFFSSDKSAVIPYYSLEANTSWVVVVEPGGAGRRPIPVEGKVVGIARDALLVYHPGGRLVPQRWETPP